MADSIDRNGNIMESEKMNSTEEQLKIAEREKAEKTIKCIFAVRAVLWVIALGFTIHWIYWSFHLYNIGIMDPHEYATILRPILYRNLIISVVCILISFKFRSISDKIKDKIDPARNAVEVNERTRKMRK